VADEAGWNKAQKYYKNPLFSSVVDPDPSDPFVFGPPESGSLYHQAKIVRKTLIPTAL
jgi:hypothetical protein